MSFFRNKHVIIAMIVAPILAVVTYYAVDGIVKERPHVAVAGQAYPLVAKSNCRYTSGECDLENAEFKSTLSVESELGVISLKSSHALKNATIGFVQADGNESQPALMSSQDDSHTVWKMKLPLEVDASTVARLAIEANGAFYFAETTMGFSDYATSFQKDFRKNAQ